MRDKMKEFTNINTEHLHRKGEKGNIANMYRERSEAHGNVLLQRTRLKMSIRVSRNPILTMCVSSCLLASGVVLVMYKRKKEGAVLRREQMPKQKLYTLKRN